MIKQIDNNYSVDDRGNVYSRPRLGTKGGILKLMISKTGYHTVMLAPDRRPRKVHRLVAAAFIPNPENKPFVNHKDGNKLNNCVENLEWCTKSENARHAFTHGLITTKKGVEKKNCKFSEDEIRLIRKTYKPGSSAHGAAALARLYGVHRSTIVAIVRRERWRHI